MAFEHRDVPDTHPTQSPVQSIALAASLASTVDASGGSIEHVPAQMPAQSPVLGMPVPPDAVHVPWQSYGHVP
jgi:hypothetical protein